MRERWPSLAAMERGVGNLRVRNVGTIGGNLCFADPHSDPATYLIAAGGSVSVRRGGAAARRDRRSRSSCRGPYETALEPGELLVAVHVPAPAPGSALVHRKMSFHERPAITVAANVAVPDGAGRAARVAVGSVGVAPSARRGAEQALTGSTRARRSAERLAAAARPRRAEAEPVADSNGSVEYKRQLVRVLTAPLRARGAGRRAAAAVTPAPDIAAAARRRTRPRRHASSARGWSSSCSRSRRSMLRAPPARRRWRPPPSSSHASSERRRAAG